MGVPSGEPPEILNDSFVIKKSFQFQVLHCGSRELQLAGSASKMLAFLTQNVITSKNLNSPFEKQKFFKRSEAV